MSSKPKLSARAKPTGPWPLSLAEKEALGALMIEGAKIQARIEALWADAARRHGVDPKTPVRVDEKAAAWVAIPVPAAP